MKLVIVGKNSIEAYTTLWVCKRILKDDCEIVMMGQGDPLPDIVKREVLVFGISFSRNLISRMIKEAGSFGLFNNDFKSKQELSGIKEVKINIKHTPARMAWEYLRGGVQVKVGPAKDQIFRFTSAPWIVDYSEDPKLWKWPNLNPFFITLAVENCYRRELPDWDELATRDMECLIAQGKEFKQNQPAETPKEEDHGTTVQPKEGSPGEDAQPGSATRRARRKLPKQ